MKLITLLLILSSFAVHANTKATATITSPKIKKLDARVELTQVAQGVKFTTTVSGLGANSVHGYHVHEKGKCDGPDFESAGDHFNPTSHQHNGPAAETKHAGDLGNLVANSKGIAKSEVIIESTDKAALAQYIGKAIIIHAKPDDLATQPSGNSGDRIACGVIK